VEQDTAVPNARDLGGSRVTPILAFVVLTAVTLVWFALPFVPAFAEWRRTGVMEPLPIPADHDGDVRHFAKRFRTFVASEPEREQGETTSEYSARRVATLRAFVAHSPLVVDRDSVIPGDVYATTSVYGWDDVEYRGLLADEDVALGRRSLVTRWIHTAGNLRVGAASALLGRASADGLLRVEEGTSFEWLSAPRIEFGARRDSAIPIEHAPAPAAPTLAPRCIDDDLDIPAGSQIDEDLIVSGQVRVGEGSTIRRSIKSHRTLELSRGVSVRGSLVSNTDVVVADDCAIGGIVVAERSIQIGARTRIGRQATLSTVSAPKITVAPGAVVHGTVWARESGFVG
jgi:carbonic anhydrase/acetyltransferase-like protein (isoleucine patch superfamily)